MYIYFELEWYFFDCDSTEDGLSEVGPPFFELSRYFDDIALYDPGDLYIVMLVVDGGLDEVVEIEWRTPIGASIVILDVFYIIQLRLNSAPRRFIGH